MNKDKSGQDFLAALGIYILFSGLEKTTDQFPARVK